MKLENKVVLITGAAAGIGLAAAQQCLLEGAAVVLVDLDEAALLQALQTLGSSAASHIAADVADAGQMENVVRTAVARHGGIDVFIANAGIEGAVAEIADYPVEDFERVLAVNVKGVFLGLKFVIPALRERGGGSIVITSSGAGVGGVPKLSGYVASKHAVIGLMRSAALECARYGIRVNTVNPGPVETRMMRSIEDGNAPGAGDRVRDKFVAAVPLRRYAAAAEIARVMVFLASDDSSYCTGGVYMADGGGST